MPSFLPLSGGPIGGLPGAGLVVGESVPILLPRTRYTRQPQGAVTLDTGRSLAQGLVFSLFNSQQDYTGQLRNAAPKQYAITRSGSAFVADVRGVNKQFNGSSDYEAIAIDMSVYSRFTLSFYLYVSAYLNNDGFAFEYTANSNSNNAFSINPQSSAGVFGIAVHGGGSYSDKTLTRPSLGWHHFSIGFDLTQSGNAAIPHTRIDGSDAPYSSGYNATAPFTLASASTLYLMSRGGSSLFGAGRLANVCLHGRLLSLGEAKALSANPYQLLMPPPARIASSPAVRSYGTFAGNVGASLVSQPMQRPALIRSHTLARGLVCSLFNAGADALQDPYDYVSGRRGRTVRGAVSRDPVRGMVHNPVTGSYQTIVVDLSPYRYLTFAWWEYVATYNNTSWGYGADNWPGLKGVGVNPNSGDGTINLWAFKANGQASIRQLPRPAAGAWNHYVWQLDLDASTTTLGAWRNTVLQSLGTNGYYGSASGPFRLESNWNLNFGTNVLGGGPSCARILNFNIYNRTLSDSERYALYKNPWQMFGNAPKVLSVTIITTNLGGPYSLTGIITAATIPLSTAIVRLYNEATGALLRETTTDGLGAYRFGGPGDEINPDVVYTIIAYDAITGFQYNGGVARGLRSLRIAA